MRVSFPATPLQALSTLPLLAAPSLISSQALPELYSNYKASGDSLSLFVALLLAKRLTLYACAATSVYVAARRSTNVPPGLGARVEQLTAEAMFPFKYPEAEQEEFKAVVKRLDTTSDATQAASLPLLFGALLVSAYAFNVLIGTDQPPPATDDAYELAALVEAMRGTATAFQPLSTASVCLFALNAELQAFVSALLPSEAMKRRDDALSEAMNDLDEPSATPPATLASITFLVAVAAVGASYLAPAAQVWPLQNTLNACIAIGVARVLQLPSLAAACAALAGLALYDGVGTLGAASASSTIASALDAATITMVAAPQASPSVMEGVAQARLGMGSGAGSQLWQPGLLTVLLQGRPTDALGLGDIVGPSILAGWAHRFDVKLEQRQQKDDFVEGTASGSGDAGDRSGKGSDGGYLAVALSGYAIGCVLLEVAPPELTRAALLFLAPPMLIAVIARLVVTNDLPLALKAPPLEPTPIDGTVEDGSNKVED